MHVPNIHATALVSSSARIGEGVSIGPFCIIEDHVSIGDGCVLHARVSIKEGTQLGPNNQVFEGAVLGGPPQHLRAGERVGRVRIGAGNVIREHVTVHRPIHEDGWTVIGDGNMLMAGCHVAHDCQVGHRTILANHVLLAGHVVIEDRAYLSGGVGVHQFCRIGKLAMVGGHARITRDVPPYVTVDGESSCIVGLNTIGLRRAGVNSERIRQIKVAYRTLYRSGRTWAEVLKELGATPAGEPAHDFFEFLSQTKRGIVQERRRARGTLRVADYQTDRRIEHDTSAPASDRLAG